MNAIEYYNLQVGDTVSPTVDFVMKDEGTVAFTADRVYKVFQVSAFIVDPGGEVETTITLVDDQGNEHWMDAEHLVTFNKL